MDLRLRVGPEGTPVQALVVEADGNLATARHVRAALGRQDAKA